VKISVVVPVHNEAGNILPLINEIVTAMQSAEAYEIIYVDDGSTDESPTILKQALQDVGALRVIRHQQSCGQSTAVHTGVKAAKYDWIATLDGDGQNDPADIPHLYQVVIEKQKSCISWRWLQDGAISGTIRLGGCFHQTGQWHPRKITW